MNLNIGIPDAYSSNYVEMYTTDSSDHKMMDIQSLQNISECTTTSFAQIS